MKAVAVFVLIAFAAMVSSLAPSDLCPSESNPWQPVLQVKTVVTGKEVLSQKSPLLCYGPWNEFYVRNISIAACPRTSHDTLAKGQTAANEAANITVTFLGVKNLYPHKPSLFGTDKQWPGGEIEKTLVGQGIIYNKTTSGEFSDTISVVEGEIKSENGKICLSPLEWGEYKIKIDATRAYEVRSGDETFDATENQALSIPFRISLLGAFGAEKPMDENYVSRQPTENGPKQVRYEYVYRGSQKRVVTFRVIKTDTIDTIITVKRPDGNYIDIYFAFAQGALLTIKDGAGTVLGQLMVKTDGTPVFGTERQFLDGVSLGAKVTNSLDSSGADVEITLATGLQAAVQTGVQECRTFGAKIAACAVKWGEAAVVGPADPAVAKGRAAVTPQVIPAVVTARAEKQRKIKECNDCHDKKQREYLALGTGITIQQAHLYVLTSMCRHECEGLNSNDVTT